jgi:hypothetical protein
MLRPQAANPGKRNLSAVRFVNTAEKSISASGSAIREYMIDIFGVYDCMLVGASVLLAAIAFASAFEFRGTGRRLWRWLATGIVCAGLGFGSRYLSVALRANLRLVSIAVLIVSLLSVAICFCSARQSKLWGKTDTHLGRKACTERDIHIHG